jgi:6-phosphogluconolactonase
MNVRILIAVPTMVLVLWAGGSAPAGESSPGAVYTMTNDPSGNRVVILNRDSKGVLTEADAVSTGGKGSGGAALDALGSQGSLALSKDRSWLLAVNAGSNEISVFRVVPNGLDLVGRVGSGGVFPVSLTTVRDLVYVLNGGVSPNITGFNLSRTGQLTALANSRRPLSGGFAQVGFDPKGETLVVSGKADSKILVFSVGKDGVRQ